MRVRVEFRLTMPGVNTWNGRWSGEGRNHSIVRALSRTEAEALLEGQPERSWRHRWDDGWCAEVTARIVPAGARLRKSDGFCGYDWMVRNIIAYRDTREPDPARSEL
jgi:hypothetical protein